MACVLFLGPLLSTTSFFCSRLHSLVLFLSVGSLAATRWQWRYTVVTVACMSEKKKKNISVLKIRLWRLSCTESWARLLEALQVYMYLNIAAQMSRSEAQDTDCHGQWGQPVPGERSKRCQTSLLGRSVSARLISATHWLPLHQASLDSIGMWEKDCPHSNLIPSKYWVWLVDYLSIFAGHCTY